MAASEGRIHVEVAFALPARQRIVELDVVQGTTVRQAVTLAELARYFPEVAPGIFEQADLGIFGKPVRDPETQVLREGDRVEVYRPLELDPKAARAERAARTRQ